MASKDDSHASDSDDKKQKSASRPQSARRQKSKRGVKLEEAAKASLLMSGLKTEKEKLLARQLAATLKKINDRDSIIKSLHTQISEHTKKIDKLDSVNKKSRNAVYKEQKMRTSAISEQQRIKAMMAKIQKAVSARLKLLGIDFDNITTIGEALDASLKAINQLIAELSKKEDLLAEMERNMNKLRDKLKAKENQIEALKAKVDKQAKIIADLKRIVDEQNAKIAALEEENKQLKDENASLKDELEKLKAAFDAFKKETAEKFDKMAKEILDAKAANVEKQAEIDDLRAKVDQLEQAVADRDAIIAERDATIEDQNNRIKELEEMVKDRDATIADRDALIEELRKEIERLLAIINKPKESTLVQTDISGAIDKQLSDYPRLLKEIVALKQLLEKKNQRIKDLEEENRILLLDLQYLLKKSVGFYSDRAVHTGQVWHMSASPNRFIVATGATDMSVRIWRINTEPDKTKGQKTAQVIKTARVDGKIDSLCFNGDGSMLACGTGYRDGADGFVVVWSMEKGPTQYEVLHAIRSRPTLRFGRTYALCFSPNGEYVYCGDTVGSIWVINLESERIVGLIQQHTDIVYDVITDPRGVSLYSVSSDQTLAVIVLPPECGGNKGARLAWLAEQKDCDDDGGDDLPGFNTRNSSVRDVTPGLKPRKSGGKGKKDKKKGKGKKDKHLRGRSSSKIAKKDDTRKLSSMTLKELLAQEKDDEYKTYEGITIARDDKYAFWRVAMSIDGTFVVCATRKIKIFKITGNDTIEKGPAVSDMDMEHVRALHVHKGLILSTRATCPRAKLFNLGDGKVNKPIKCKKAVAQADFLCDGAHVAILQQELIPNEAPRPCAMRLYQYNKDVKIKVDKEPSTPTPAPSGGKTPTTPSN